MFEPVMNSFHALMAMGETTMAQELAEMQHFKIGFEEYDFIMNMMILPDLGDEPCTPTLPLDTMLPAQNMTLTLGSDKFFFTLSVLPPALEVMIIEWRGAEYAPVGKFTPGQPDGQISTEYPKSWGFGGCSAEQSCTILVDIIANSIALINQPRIVLKKPAGSRSDRRRIKREMGGIGPAAWFEVKWNVGKTVIAKTGTTIDDRHGVALHFKRAHWRKTNEGAPKAHKRPDAPGFWCRVRESWVGHPAYGIRLHQYTPKLSDVAISNLATARAARFAMQSAGY